MALLLYLRGMVRAYRTAGAGWKCMDRDVRVVFLLAVPLFRGGIFHVGRSALLHAQG
jgi:hypothetical protein